MSDENRAAVVRAMLRAIDDWPDLSRHMARCRDANQARAVLTSEYGFTAFEAEHVLDLSLRRVTARAREALAAELSSDDAGS